MMRLERQDIAPGVTMLLLAGRLDFRGCQDIESEFNAAAAAGQGLVVDLSQVTFIASIGLRLLIVTARTVSRTGGSMALLQPASVVEPVLVSSGIGSVVPILHDLQEAVRAVRP